MRNLLNKGFTLIELLVVMAVIAILIAVSIFAFSSVQMRSRDAKRKADLALVQSALEQYRADQHNYPVTGNVGIGTTTNSLKSPDGSITYLKSMPADPLVPTSTQYTYLALLNSYCLYANMESSASGKTLTVCPTPAVAFDKPYEVTAP